MKKNAPKKIALCGILAALAIAMSYLESLLPAFVPIPGAKAGFSNIVTMLSVSLIGFPYGFAVTLFKALFALITRGTTAAALSFAGGLLSLFMMTLLFKSKRIGCWGIGILSACCHNLGQLLVSLVILGSSVLSLSPYLLLMSAVTGMLTGTVYKYINDALKHTGVFTNFKE